MSYKKLEQSIFYENYKKALKESTIEKVNTQEKTLVKKIKCKDCKKDILKIGFGEVIFKTGINLKINEEMVSFVCDSCGSINKYNIGDYTNG